MFFKSLVATALLVTSVSAQAGANSTIDPTSVDLTTRSQWCSAELNTCGTLCSGDASTNTCDENTLLFNCTCAANSSTPGLAWYTGTLPTFICELNFQRCISTNAGVKASQDKCISDEKNNCGHLDPANFTAPVSSSSSASSTPSPTSGSDSTAATTSASSSSSTGAAATMLAIGGEYGAGMVAAGVAAAFGLML